MSENSDSLNIAVVLQFVALQRELCDVTCAMIGGSSAVGEGNDLDLCVVAASPGMGRVRSRIGGVVVDALIGSRSDYLEAIRSVRSEHVVTMCASAEHAWGDVDTADEIRRVARDVDAAGPPPLSQVALFRYGSEPFDLLRKYKALLLRDPQTSQIVLGRLISSSLEAFFGINRQWNPEFSHTLSRLRELNPGGAAVLSRLLEAVPGGLHTQAQLAETLVHMLVGEEPEASEFWPSAGVARPV